MKKALVDKHFLIQKKEEKNGWHYVVISHIVASEKNNLGLVRKRID